MTSRLCVCLQQRREADQLAGDLLQGKRAEDVKKQNLELYNKYQK